VLFDYNRYMYVRGNALNMVDPSGHIPCIAQCIPVFWDVVEGLGQVISDPDIAIELLPDMYETYSSVEVSFLMTLEYGRSTYYDFETNAIHDTHNFNVGVGEPGATYLMARSIVYFDNDVAVREIGSENAIAGQSYQADGEVGFAIASFPFASERNYTAPDELQMTIYALGASLGPDLFPVSGSISGNTTWVIDTKTYGTEAGSNADMARGILGHRIEKGQFNSIPEIIETFGMMYYALIK